MARINWSVGDNALTRDDKVVKIINLVREDGVEFAWVRYLDPADEPTGNGYVTPGVWEHCVRTRECWQTEYPRDPETGEYERAWDGGIKQVIVTSRERGLRRVPEGA